MDLFVSGLDGRVPITMLYVKGDIDSTTYIHLEARALEEIKRGARDLLIDLTEVPYISSAGLRAVNVIYKQLHRDELAPGAQTARRLAWEGAAKSPHLKLVNPTQRVREVLMLAGFDTYLDIHANQKDAIEAF